MGLCQCVQQVIGISEIFELNEHVCLKTPASRLFGLPWSAWSRTTGAVQIAQLDLLMGDREQDSRVEFCFLYGMAELQFGLVRVTDGGGNFPAT